MIKFCDALRIVDTLVNNFQEDQIEDMIFEIVDFKEVIEKLPTVFKKPESSVNWVQYMTQYGKAIFLCNGAKGLQDLASSIVKNLTSTKDATFNK